MQFFQRPRKQQGSTPWMPAIIGRYSAKDAGRTVNPLAQPGWVQYPGSRPLKNQGNGSTQSLSNGSRVDQACESGFIGSSAPYAPVAQLGEHPSEGQRFEPAQEKNWGKNVIRGALPFIAQ